MQVPNHTNLSDLTDLMNAFEPISDIRQRENCRGRGKSHKSFLKTGTQARLTVRNPKGDVREIGTILVAGTHYIPADNGWRSVSKLAKTHKLEVLEAALV